MDVTFRDILLWSDQILELFFYSFGKTARAEILERVEELDLELKEVLAKYGPETVEAMEETSKILDKVVYRIEA